MIDLDKKIIKIVQEERLIGLRGKLGVCITWFALGEGDNENPYTHQAQLLLQDIIQSFSFDNRMDLLDGLTGIGLGMDFLVSKGYVDGDINRLLRHLDAKIYKVGCQAMNMDLQGKEGKAMTDILLYELVRYDRLDNKWQKECCRRYIVSLLNHIYINRGTCFYDEPLPFTLHWRQYCFPLE